MFKSNNIGRTHGYRQQTDCFVFGETYQHMLAGQAELIVMHKSSSQVTARSRSSPGTPSAGVLVRTASEKPWYCTGSVKYNASVCREKRKPTCQPSGAI